MAHLPFVDEAFSAKPLTPPTCDQTPAKCQAGRVRSHRGWLVSCDGYDGSAEERRRAWLSADDFEAILALCEWNGFTAPREPIQGHGCFLPRKGRSCVRRPWKSGSGIDESGRRRTDRLRSDET